MVRNTVILLSILSPLASCTQLNLGSTPPREIPAAVVANAAYGPPPPSDYETILQQAVLAHLVAPNAPQITVDLPRRGYTKANPSYGTEEKFGWRVCGHVNNKSSQGSYTGRVGFFALFQGASVVELIMGDLNPLSYSSRSIDIACNR